MPANNPSPGNTSTSRRLLAVTPQPTPGQETSVVLATTATLLPVSLPRKLKPLPIRTVAEILQFRWASWFFLGGLLAAALAAIAYQMIPARFVASAQLRIASEAQSILPGDAQRSEFTNYLRTQVAFLRSTLVLQAALRTPTIQEIQSQQPLRDPSAPLQDDLKVDFQDGSELVRVSLAGDDPHWLAGLVNGLVEAYFREGVEEENRRKRQRMLRMEQTIRTLQTSLEQKEGKSSARLTSQRNARTQNQKANVLLPKLQDQAYTLEGQIAASQLAITQAQKRLHNARQEMKDEPNWEDKLEREPGFQAVKQAWQNEENRIAEHLRIYGDARPDRLENLRADARDAQEKFYQWKEKRRQELRLARLPDWTRQLEQEYIQAKETLTRLRQQKKLLDNQLEVMEDSLDQLPEVEPEMDVLQLDRQARQTLLGNLVDRVNLLRVDLETPPRVQLLQAANVPTRRDVRRQWLGMALAGLGAFVLVGFALVQYERRVNRLFHHGDAEQLGTVLGVLPVPRPGRDWHIAHMQSCADRLREELYRLMVPEQGGVILAVVSSQGEDGKTTLAWEIACSFHRSGCRVAIVDADLRTPTLHTMIDPPVKNRETPGVLAWLHGETRWDDIAHSREDGLLVAPAGAWQSAAVAQLRAEDISASWNHLRRCFDVSVVLLPPWWNAPEAGLFTRYVDAAVVAVQRGRTGMEPLARLLQRLEGPTPAFTGLVLMDGTAAECK